MKSLTALKDKRGFTLVEIMVVISMLVIVASFTLYFDFDNFRSYSFHGDKDTLISGLQHARSRAVSNICYGPTCTDGKPHGVRISANQYIIFQGASFATRDGDYDAVLEANPTLTHAGINEVVFAQLTGDTTAGSITVTDTITNRTTTITLNSEGQILWTN